MTPAAFSAQTLDLYSQSVDVEDRSLGVRRSAARQALEVVLMRVSGDATVVALPTITSALNSSSQYVSGYRYQTSESESGVSSLQAVFEFDETSIDQLLKSSRVPIWPATRPEAVIWLVKDDLASGRQLVPLQEGQEGEWISSAAHQRGVPLVLPMMDLEDRLTISPHELWRLDAEKVLSASQRYRSEVLVVGRYGRVSSGNWLSSWVFLHGDRQEYFDAEADTDIEVLYAGVNALADFLAEQYSLLDAPTGSDQSPSGYWLRVGAVENFKQYLSVKDYLAQLPVFDQVRLVEAGVDFLLFQAASDSGLDSVMDVLALDRKLMARQAKGRQSQLPDGSAVNPLQFDWVN